jgi:hypothetical protein
MTGSMTLEQLQQELAARYDPTQEEDAEYIVWLDCILDKIRDLEDMEYNTPW